MYVKKYSFILLIVLFTILSCKKGRPPVPQPTSISNAQVDVYAVGYIYTDLQIYTAAYWKNGVINKLVADSSVISQANAIVVSGADVYIAGTVFGVATYWENGIATELQGGSRSFANAIAVDNNDVYVAGAMGTSTPNSVAEYWKNGQAYRLVTDSSSFSWAYGIAVSGKDVYIAGYTTGVRGFIQATYWKNGVATVLGDSLSPSNASAISLNGADVYIAGNIGSNNTVAAYWKNGVASIVSQPGSRASGIAVYGKDVYIAGNTGYERGAYWKNGALTNLPFFSTVLAVTVNGTDVYAAGYSDASNKPTASYWKNGVEVQLSQNAVINGITLVPQ